MNETARQIKPRSKRKPRSPEYAWCDGAQLALALDRAPPPPRVPIIEPAPSTFILPPPLPRYCRLGAYRGFREWMTPLTLADLHDVCVGAGRQDLAIAIGTALATAVRKGAL